MALKHWTSKSINDFVYKIASDFVLQIENSLGETKQSAFAKKLGVSPATVSQALNKPGNLGLRKMVEYARALGKKVSVVVYDDGDPDNARGPINSQVFAECWVRQGRPADFFELQADASTQAMYVITPVVGSVNLQLKPQKIASNSAAQSIGIRTTAGTDGPAIATAGLGV